MSAPKTVNQKVDSREDKSCLICGVYADGGSRHHRLLRSRGGKDTLDNLILLCGSGTTGCHGWVHAHPEEATFRGYMVPSGSVPAEAGVWHPGVQGGMFVYLDTDLPVYLSQPYGAVVEAMQ